MDIIRIDPDALHRFVQNVRETTTKAQDTSILATKDMFLRAIQIELDGIDGYVNGCRRLTIQEDLMNNFR